MVTLSLMEDRISRIMSCGEEYQEAKLHERVAHDKLMEINSNRRYQYPVTICQELLIIREF